MRGINQVILLGFLGKDPEYKQFPSGTEVTTFSLAVDETYRQNGQDVQKTSWHNIVVWGTMAVHCSNYLSKGSQVLVMGKISHEQYDDKDGIKRTATKIIASTVRFLDRKTQQGNSETSKPPADSADMPFPDEEELPF